MDYKEDVRRKCDSLIGDSSGVSLNKSEFAESDQRETMREPGRWGRLERTSSGDQVFRPKQNQCVTSEDYLKKAEAIAKIPVQVDENLPPKDVSEAFALLEESKSLAIERITDGWWTLNQGRIEKFPPDFDGYRSEQIISRAGDNELINLHEETKAKGGHQPKKMPLTYATMGMDIGQMIVEDSKFQDPHHDDHTASRTNWQGNNRRQPMSRVEATPNVQKGRKEPSQPRFAFQYGASNWPTLPDQSTKRPGGSNGLGGVCNNINIPNQNGKSGRSTSSGDENYPARDRPENRNGTRGFPQSQQKKRRPNWAKKFFEGIQRAINEGNQDFVAGPVHPCQLKNGDEPEKKSQVQYLSDKSSSGSAPSWSYEGSSSDEEASEPDVSSSAPNSSSEETVLHNSNEAISSSSFPFQNEVEETEKSKPAFQQAPVNQVPEASDTPAPEKSFHDGHLDPQDLSSQILTGDPQADSAGNATFTDQVIADADKLSLLEHPTECKPANIQDPPSDLKIDQVRNMRHSGQLSPELVEFASDFVDKCLEEARLRVAPIMQQQQCISRGDEKESVVVDSELVIHSDETIDVSADHLVDEEKCINDSTESGNATSVANDDNSSTIATQNTETADKSELRSSSSASENQGGEKSGNIAECSGTEIYQTHSDQNIENTNDNIESIESMAGTKTDLEILKTPQILHAEESLACKEEDSEMLQQKSELVDENFAAPASDLSQKLEPVDENVAASSSDLSQKSESVDTNIADPLSDLRQQDDPGHESCTDATVTRQAQSCEIQPETKTDENISEHTKSIEPAYVAQAAKSRQPSLDSMTSGEAPGPLPSISAPDVQTIAEGLGHAQLVDTVNPSDIEAAAAPPTTTATESARILPTDKINVPSLNQKESTVEEGVKEVEAAASPTAKGDTKKPKVCLQQ